MSTLARRFLRAISLLTLGLVVMAGLGFGLLVWQVDRLGGRDEARPSDVIIVLGARVGQDGRPGSDLTSRTYHGVDLWNAGLAPHIICTGGFKDEPLSAAAVCRKFAIELGVPQARVWLADGSSDTAGDAVASAGVMAEHGWRTAILVSHPMHLFRARWLFRQAGIEAVTSPTTTDTTAIFPPVRLYYAVREAGGIVLTALDQTGALPGQVKTQLRVWAYGLP